jgi:hypothetical protein
MGFGECGQFGRTKNIKLLAATVRGILLKTGEFDPENDLECAQKKS